MSAKPLQAIIVLGDDVERMLPGTELNSDTTLATSFHQKPAEAEQDVHLNLH